MKRHVMFLFVVLLITSSFVFSPLIKLSSVYAGVIKRESQSIKKGDKSPIKSNLSVDMIVSYSGDVDSGQEPDLDQITDDGDGQGSGTGQGDVVTMSPMPTTSDNSLVLSKVCLILLIVASGLTLISQRRRKTIS